MLGASWEGRKNKLKAILTYTTMEGGKPVEKTRLFDTTRAKKICDVKNSFKNKVQEIYITKKGIIFIHTITGNEKLEVADQEKIKAWIGKNEPDKYCRGRAEAEKYNRCGIS